MSTAAPPLLQRDEARLGWTEHRLPAESLDSMSEVRSNNVSTRLNDEELARWQAAAKTAGKKTVGGWNREFVNLMLDVQDGKTVLPGVATETIEALRRRAQNIAHIARVLEGLEERLATMDAAEVAEFEQLLNRLKS